MEEQRDLTKPIKNTPRDIAGDHVRFKKGFNQS